MDNILDNYTYNPLRKTMKNIFLNKKKLMDKYNKVDYIKLSHN